MKCSRKITRNQRILSFAVGSFARASISAHSQKIVSARPTIHTTATNEKKPVKKSWAINKVTMTMPPRCPAMSTPYQGASLVPGRGRIDRSGEAESQVVAADDLAGGARAQRR